MNTEEIQQILDNQRNFFLSGKTLETGYRIEALKKMRSLIYKYEPEIINGLSNDFRKPEFEVIATETRFVLQELNYAIRHLRKWSRPRRIKTPLIHFIAHSRVIPQPYGQVLVISPWNYPFHLAFLPLISAIAAGNCVVLKVSRKVPATALIMKRIIEEFPPELVVMLSGDHTESEFILNYKFDYIFFTGSTEVGRHVMEKAAVNLTPFSLELGGKNPCVVTADADLPLAARRIAWGKFINAGQTCIAPDYLLVDKRVREQLIGLLRINIEIFYGKEPEKSPDLARIVNKEKASRLSALLRGADIAIGGMTDVAECYMSPTVLQNVRPEDPVMKEEIFGPILPVIDFEDINDIYSIIEQHPKPLASYIFSKSKNFVHEFLMKTQSGTAAVNETIMQVASPYLPFGGTGPSGLGRYHGRKSFETFSNMKSVLYKSNLIDLPMRYPPYNSLNAKIVKWVMK